MDRTRAPRIRRRRTRRLMCSCDAEFKPQPVAVDNVVTNAPTENNQIMPNDIEKIEVGKNITSPLY